MIQQIAKITMKAPRIKYRIPNVSAMKSPTSLGDPDRNAHRGRAQACNRALTARTLIAALALSILAVPSSAETLQGRAVRVFDGDTIIVQTDEAGA
jgi:hypothetical protein